MVSLAESSINGEASVTVLFRAVTSLENAGKPVPSARVAKLLNDALTKDAGLLSLGLGLQLAAKLSRTDQAPFLARIPAAISQADEVDGRLLQYEGGLGVTVSIFKGILDLSTAANSKETGISSVQVIKFVNYFLSRSTVQTAKNGAELLQVLKLLSANKYQVPVIVSLYGSTAVSANNPNLVIKVTNAFGGSLNREFRVSAKLNDLSDVLKFSPVQGDSTLFAIDLLSQPKRWPAGRYTLKVTVEPVKVDRLLVISGDAQFSVAIQSKVSLDSIEIGVGEKDQLAIHHELVEYPAGLKKGLECDGGQKLSVKFCVRDQTQSKDLTVQQALIYFVNAKTNEETVFVADLDRISKVYNKDVNLAYRGKEFNYQSGDYLIKLVVGDALLQEPISWTLGKVNIQFNQDAEVEGNWLQRYEAKPEIVHRFREPEKRPPVLVSHAFTLAALTPVLVLLFSWYLIGLNLSRFRFSLSALLFHGSLGLIFALYTLFFIRLNMFVTIKCLSGVLVLTFLSGYYLLRGLASSTKLGSCDFIVS